MQAVRHFCPVGPADHRPIWHAGAEAQAGSPAGKPNTAEKEQSAPGDSGDEDSMSTW